MSKKSKRGPKPERVKIDEDWEEAIDKALRKKRPQEGWPDHKERAMNKFEQALSDRFDQEVESFKTDIDHMIMGLKPDNNVLIAALLALASDNAEPDTQSDILIVSMPLRRAYIDAALDKAFDRGMIEIGEL